MNPPLCTTLNNARNLRFESAELIRGGEQQLLAEMLPAVRQTDLALDLGRVERIDAAGIAALLQLYTEALQAGRHFKVSNPSRRVAAMLALVGLGPILLCRGVAPRPDALNCDCRRPAA